VDGATPVIIKGVHVASLFTGQIFLEPPDLERFREQAHRFGYDEKAYLEALEQVPVVTEERFRAALRFLGELAVMVGEMGLANLRMRDAADELRREYVERCQAEQALLESEKLYRDLIQQSNDAVYLLYDGKFEVVNQRFLEMFEVTEDRLHAPDFDLSTMVAPRSRDLIDERAARFGAGEALENKYEFTALSGTGREIEVEASVSYIEYKEGIAIQGILRDITDRLRLERHLRQTQKMEAVGTLAGGVAHDFNNLLTVINGYCEILLHELSGDHPLNREVMAIADAGSRAERLTRKLLSFSRRQVHRPEVINLDTIVTEMDGMLRRLIGEDILMETRAGRLEENIKVDPLLVEQVLTNLVVNARDAVRQAGGADRRITVETGTADLDAEQVASHPDSAPGRHVYLAVSDNGVGMDDETRQKIFEPFFTTKEMHRGTGLGLSMVYGIVTQCRGSVSVHSEPGRGAMFKVYFPVTGEPRETGGEEEEADQLMGTETVLVVEDEDEVRALTVNAVLACGYTVHQAVDGRQALEAIRTERLEVDLLITDVIMPGMSGTELAKRVTDLCPGARVIFVSGYATEFLAEGGSLLEKVNYLQKPFTVKALAREIRRVLDGR
jgi:hypothetical protein